MKHIHPFPARMAPEIALDRIQSHSEADIILDPMAGSGMVLSQAARSNVKAIGVDLDPMAFLIASVGSTAIDKTETFAALEELISAAKASVKVDLPWIDNDTETDEFIKYWFHPKQIAQLRPLAYHLNKGSDAKCQKINNALKVALSRLIITKEPKASLARDTAHSRPHRTILENDFDIYQALPSSLSHVMNALDPESLRVNASLHLGDARKLDMISDCSVDRIITSPPYLNAIDYMRGHRLSLVWLGFSFAQLRDIRSQAIGTERTTRNAKETEFAEILESIGLSEMNARQAGMLKRYYEDLFAQTAEACRVLKPGKLATYVIGNSTVKGLYIKNSELLKIAAAANGLSVKSETTREIPEHMRYMPVVKTSGNALASRMRVEHVIDFQRVFL